MSRSVGWTHGDTALPLPLKKMRKDTTMTASGPSFLIFPVAPMKPIFFCFGDFRTGEKQYRIFKVQNVEDAYKVADELGYDIVLDNCIKAMYIPNVEERTIISILETIEAKLKDIENVVACHRAEYDEVQRMKQHFLNSDMKLYFPKKLPEPVEIDLVVNGQHVLNDKREHPWITEYWVRKYRESEQRGITVRVLEPDAMIMQNAAIREKKQSQE